MYIVHVMSTKTILKKYSVDISNHVLVLFPTSSIQITVLEKLPKDISI